MPRATASPSGHQWSPPNGRICCPHPIGESHDGHALLTRRASLSGVPSMFPIPLSRNETPSTAPAVPIAPRAVEASCEVVAATPTKASPTAATAAPAVNDPAAGWPLTNMASPSVTASTRFAPTATVTAAARAAYRPTTVAPSISARPSSSSWRVWRTTVSVLISPASTASET